MTTPILRTSERTSFKRCPQQWWWGYREGLVPKGPPSDALWFGTGIHLALAEWYQPGLKRGTHPAETWESWVADEVRFLRTQPFDGADYKEETYVEAGKLGVEMLHNYVKTYGKDSDWEVLSPEQTFEIEVELPDGSSVLYAGTWDLVFRQRSTKKIWLGEHKTAKAIFLGHLPLDDQAGSYWTTASQILRADGTLKKADRIEGIMYNFLRKGVPDSRPRNADGMCLNKDGSVSKVQPSPLLRREPVYRTRAELNSQVRRIQDEATVMNAMRSGDLPLYKTPTRDCAYMCKFYEMCMLHENGDDWEEYRGAMFKVSDPYADHRKSAADGD